MSGAQPAGIPEAGLNSTQAQQVRNIVMEIAAAAHNEAVAAAHSSLEATRDLMIRAADEVTARQENQRLEHQRVTQEIADSQGAMMTQISATDERNKNLMIELAQKKDQIQEVVTQLTAHAQRKDEIIDELDKKQKAIEVLSQSVQVTMHELTGGWKQIAEGEMRRLSDEVVYTKGEIVRQVEMQSVRFGNLEQYVQGLLTQGLLSHGAPEGRSGVPAAGPSRIGGDGKWKQKGLIFEKDLKLPEFPANPKT